MSNNLSSRVLVGLAGLVESYGQDPCKLARCVGLEPAALYRSDMWIEGVVYNDFLEEAAIVCEDRFFSLKLASIQSWQILGPLWHIVRRAKTVGDVLRVLAAYLESHSKDSSCLLIENEAGMSLCYEARLSSHLEKGRHVSRVQVVEFTCAMYFHEMRRMLGRDWCSERVQFRHSAPEFIKPLKQVCGENLWFNQDVNAVHINREDCERSIVHVPDLPPLNSPHNVAVDLDLNRPFVLEVERAIRMLVNRGQASVDQVSQTLGVSPRTLQHKLQQQGTSYQDLLDLTRIDLALQYLNDSNLNTLAISERLGFTDTAVFSRFFKKYMKMSPRDYSKRIKMR